MLTHPKFARDNPAGSCGPTPRQGDHDHESLPPLPGTEANGWQSAAPPPNTAAEQEGASGGPPAPPSGPAPRAAPAPTLTREFIRAATSGAFGAVVRWLLEHYLGHP